MTHCAPDLDEIRRLAAQQSADIYRTPVVRCVGLEELLDNDTRVYGKLEFLQRTGTFKARGALATVRGLSPAQLKAGITAVSAGNHAIAAAFAASVVGVSAKVVMIKTANPYRIEAAKQFGAEIVMAGDAHEAFELAERIQRDEGRYLVHPFEGPAVAAGTGTLGLEICEDVDAFDAVVVAVGGGGLIGGVANAVKLVRPEAQLFGVEVKGADSMHRSLRAGEPVRLETVDTIADSLGAPFAMPYSFDLCEQHVDHMAMLSDKNLSDTMGILYHRMKIAVEPACAAAAAALLGPLRESLAGQRVVLLFCGSNIDWATWQAQANLELPGL